MDLLEVGTPGREYFYLFMQTLCITAMFVWIWLLGIKLHYQKYGYYYIFVRLVFYNDRIPFNWLMEHKLFLVYAAQIISLLLTNTGLILQIRDETLYDKPMALFCGNLFLALSVIYTIKYLTEYVTFLENRNFDEHIRDLQKKMRRLKKSQENRRQQNNDSI